MLKRNLNIIRNEVGANLGLVLFYRARFEHLHEVSTVTELFA